MFCLPSRRVGGYHTSVMNFTSTPCVARLLIFLTCCAGLHGALPVVDPIPVKEGVRLEKDFRAEEHAWGRRCLLEPAAKQWQGSPWAEEAAALVEAALEQMEKEHREVHALAPLAGRFRELLKKAPEEPLLMVLGARALFGEKEDWRESGPLLEKALARGGMSPVLETMALATRLAVAEREGVDTEALQQRWLTALGGTLTDGGYDEAGQDVLLRHHVQAVEKMDFASPNPLESYSLRVEGSNLPEWIKLTLRGAAQKELAWVKRSAAWANEVKDSQWQGFAEHLKSARDLLGQANRLRPDRPEAPTIMIIVAMGESVDATELRAWFDRAVSAQFDYAPAYKSLLWAYRPRWGGSHEVMLAFGKACADTQRYDTLVPSRLMTAAMDIIEEVYEAQAVFRHPDVKGAMVAMSRGYLDHSAAEPPLTRHLLQSNAAMCSWLADDDALAQKALDAAGPRLCRSTRIMLNSMLMHESFLRAEVAADNGAYGEAIRAAANPAPKTPLKEVHTAFMKVPDAGLAEDARAYLQEARELTGLQEAVEAGGWVDVSFHKHLTAFYQSEEGEWTVGADGTLVCHGTDHPRSRFVLRVPMGPNVEMKGEVAFEVPETVQTSEFGCGFGPMIHWLPTCTSGVRVLMGYLNPSTACVKAYCASMRNSTPDLHFPLKEWNTFSVRAADGKLTYDINGRTMATRHDMADLGLEAESGMLGFTAYRLALGAKAHVRNVSIRKITAADLAPVDGSTMVAAADGSALLPGSIMDWIWKPALLGVLVLVGIFGPRLMRSEEE